MGNCIRRDESSMVWAGDDWGSMKLTLSPKPMPSSNNNNNAAEKQSLLSDIHHHHPTNIGSLSSSSSSSSNNDNNNNNQVKIKITKRQLEELLGRSVLDHNHNNNFPHVDQLLISKLMMMSSSSSSSSAHHDHHHPTFENINIHDHDHEHQPSWRPVLQSIPEVI